MDLETLVQKFQEGDIKAFEELYHLYSENIQGVIFTILRDHVLAQEVCQDVFLKVWQRFDQYNASKGRFFTWVLNIARNAAIDLMRSKDYKNQKQNLPGSYFVSILEAAEPAAEAPVTSGKLRHLIGSLKQGCIELIELLYFRGYTQKEVSSDLNIPVGTVKTRLRSCISELRKNMKL